MEEIWKGIKGYEGIYLISNLGRIRSLNRVDSKGRTIKGCLRKLNINNRGYFKINLSKNGNTKFFGIHRLLAIAFIENPYDKECINHIDGNKLNNNLDNLEWVTKGENNSHAWSTGLKKMTHETKMKISIAKTGIPSPVGKKIICLTTGEIFNSSMEAGRKLNVHSCNIRSVCAKRFKQTGGYEFMFLSEYLDK